MLVRTIRIASLVLLLLATLLTTDALAFKPLKDGKWTFQIATPTEGVVLAEVKFKGSGQCTIFVADLKHSSCVYRGGVGLLGHFSLTVEIVDPDSFGGSPQTWVLRGVQSSDHSAQGVGWLITDLADDSDFGLATAKTTFTGTRGK
jgi:hypothetical protein